PLHAHEQQVDDEREIEPARLPTQDRRADRGRQADGRRGEWIRHPVVFTRKQKEREAEKDEESDETGRLRPRLQRSSSCTDARSSANSSTCCARSRPCSGRRRPTSEAPP